MSVLDGWWLEGWIEELTGWAIGGASDSDNPATQRFCTTSWSRKVLPLYYGDKTRGIALMKGAISRNAYFFNSHRMMRRYAVEAYLH